MKRILLTLSLAGALAVAIPVPAADEAADLDKTVAAMDGPGRRPEIKPEDFEDVSQRTKVPVEKLKKQHAETRMGSGSLLIANLLASETGQSFEAIVAEKKSGKGWGAIARAHDVKLGPLMKAAKASEQGQKGRNAAAAAKAGKGKPETPAAPGQTGPEVKPRREEARPPRAPASNPPRRPESRK
jgi:hypothetical protein